MNKIRRGKDILKLKRESYISNSIQFVAINECASYPFHAVKCTFYLNVFSVSFCLFNLPTNTYIIFFSRFSFFLTLMWYCYSSIMPIELLEESRRRKIRCYEFKSCRVYLRVAVDEKFFGTDIKKVILINA